MAVQNFLCVLVIAVSISKSVYGKDDNNIATAQPINAGFGYELVQERLDNLQYSFLELFVHVKELGEAVLNNQRTIEQGQLQSNQLIHHHQKRIADRVDDLEKGMTDRVDVLKKRMTDRVDDLENGVAANVSLMTEYAKQILDLQTICSNHDTIREELHKLKGNVTFPRVTQTNSRSLDIIQSCKTANTTASGLFKMTIEGIAEPVTVFCEMQRFGCGWLVFQQRFDGSVDFYRDWAEYKRGFGVAGKEFWLGLESMHQITKQGTYEMIVELEDFKGNYSYARYSDFEIGSEAEKYALKKLGSCSGTAGDYLSYSKGMKFSTRDSDNDASSGTCAVDRHGAWWYQACAYSNLNGEYLNEVTRKAINWFGSYTGLKYTRMMIRKT